MRIHDVAIATSGTDIAITTTTEKVAASSGPAKLAYQTAKVLIIAALQVTTGANTTGLTARIRRGTAITGTLVGEANVEQVKAAAGSTEVMFLMLAEDRAGEESVEYSLTVQQAAASADGSILQATIVVVTL